MAITAVVEDGTGVAGANLYEAVADTVTWLSDRGYPAFAAAPADEQLMHAVTMTEAAERRIARRVDGVRRVTDQGLLFPRRGASAADRSVYDDDERPESLLVAIRLLVEHAATLYAQGRRLTLTPRAQSIRSRSERGASVTFAREVTPADLYPDVFEHLDQVAPAARRQWRA